MKINIDDLERRMRAVVLATFSPGIDFPRPQPVDTEASANARVVLALIARIRELETAISMKRDNLETFM